MSDFPKKYFIEKEHVPVRRSQEYSNMCWSFSMCRAVEIAILRKFKNETRETLRLSEVHAKYSCFNMFDEEKYKNEYGFNPQDNEGTIYPAPKQNYLLGVTGAYLSRGSGVVYNDYDTFQDGVLPSKRTSSETEGKPKAYYVTDIYNMHKVFGKNAKKDWIKHALQTYSGVPISVSYNDKDYNNTHSALYCTDTKDRLAHSALIIGWDDDFPKEYFNVKPSAPGAFLIMDSSVTGSLPTLDEPYRRCYWLSYEDAFLYQNGYAIGNVIPYYNIHTIYQNNYFGVNCLFYEPDLYDTTKIKVKIKFKKTNPYSEYVKGISLYNAIRGTTVSASIIKVQSGRETVEKIVEKKALEEGGYHTLWAADSQKILLDETVQSYQVEMELKNEDANLPYCMESDTNVRNEHTQITSLEEGTQFICDECTGKQYVDIYGWENKSLGRISIKVITVPADNAWDSLQTFIGQLNLPAVIESKTDNLPASSNDNIKIQWSMPDFVKDVTIKNQTTIINTSQNDIKLLLMAELSTQGAKEKYVVQKFFNTSIKPGQLNLEPIISPKKGECNFDIKGKSPFGQNQVALYAKKNSENDEDAFLASAFGDDYDDWKNIKNVIPNEDGSFEIKNCSLGACYGKFSIKATVNGITSNLASLTIENPNDVDNEKKTVTISTSFGFTIALMIASAALYAGYQYYMRRGTRYYFRTDDHLFRRLENWILQALAGAERTAKSQSIYEDSPPVIVLENVEEEGILINEMLNSSIIGIDFEIGSNCRLIHRMSENSSLEGCNFIYSENKEEKRIMPLIKEMNQSKIKNCQISAQFASGTADHFYGIAETVSNSAIEDCSITLKGCWPEENENCAGIANEISKATMVKGCKIQCNLTGASVAGICIQSSDSTITDCQITEGSILNGTNAGGFLVNGTNTKIQNCQFEGKLSSVKCLQETQCFGSIAGSIQKGCSVENCSSKIEIDLENGSTDTYLGGIAGTADESKITLCATVIKSYKGNSINIGGIAGKLSNGAEIANCFAASVEKGASGRCGNMFGGICAVAEGAASITNCYCSLFLKPMAYAAGILFLALSDSVATLKNCYMAGGIQAALAAGIGGSGIHSFTGCVTASPYLYGSITGSYKISPSQTSISCFAYDSIQTKEGASFIDDKAIPILKADEFFQKETYEKMGWDFEDTWEMDSVRHFPKLKNMPTTQWYPFPFPYVIPPASSDTYLFSENEAIQLQGYVSPRNTKISWSLHSDNKLLLEREAAAADQEDAFTISAGQHSQGEYKLEIKVYIDGVVITTEKQIKVEKK